MKVLVLGNSDTAGLFSGGKTWTAIARDGLAQRLGETVELAEVAFGVLGPTAPLYAEKKVREHDPDLVILPVATFSFTIGFVWKRVEGLFGRRAGRWYKRVEDSFDATTRAKGSVRDCLNNAARTIARRVIGTRPLATQQETTDAYRQVVAALARVEDTQVVLVAYGQRGKHNFGRGGPERRQAFMSAVASAARDQHVLFLDGKEAYEGVPREVPTTTPDGYHQNQYGHELLGQFVARGTLDALQARV